MEGSLERGDECQSSVSNRLIRHNKISSLVLKHKWKGEVIIIPYLYELEMKCGISFPVLNIFILIDFWNFYDIIEIC